MCVCWCVCSSCSPPLLAGLCVVGVCAPAGVLAAPRHSLLGFVVCGLAVSWHLFLCRGSLRVVRAARVCGTRWPLVLRTFPCALVVACGVPPWRVSWPRVGAPRLVRSGRSPCSGRLSCCRCAFPHAGCLRPRLYWVAARGTRGPAENRAHCACRWPPPRQGRWTRSASYPFGAPRWGCPWRVPPASVLGCVPCGVLHVWTWSVTRPVSRTARLSTGDSAGAPRLFCVDADTAPFGSEDATPGSVRACVCVLSCLGRAGWPPGRVLVRLTFSCGRSCCSLSAPCPPGGGGPACVVSLFFFPPPFCAPLVSGVPCFPALGALGLGVLRSFPPPSFVSLFFSPPPCVFFFPRFLLPLFFFRAVLAVRCRGGVSWAVGRVGVCCCGPSASAGAGVRLRSVVRCPLPVPPPFVLLPVVLCVPGGAVLAALLFPLCLWWLPCGVARPIPLALGTGFFFGSGLCWLCPPPPPPGGWLCCPVLWFVVRRVVWCCGLWCVLCCVRCCVACLCSCAVLCWVVLCCCCAASLSCVAAFSAGFFLLCVVPCLSVVLWAVSVSVLCLCGAVLVCLRCWSLCAALLPLRRWLVFCVVVCCVCALAVGPGCPLLSPGGF